MRFIPPVQGEGFGADLAITTWRPIGHVVRNLELHQVRLH
jgi:hypothetical protein